MNLSGFNIQATLGGTAEQLSIINSLIGRIHTCDIVKVVGVSEGKTGATGTVTVVKLTKEYKTNGQSVDNVNIYNVPYFRLQGGKNAIIIDPQVGDLGIAIFASRDISNIKKTKEQSVPATHAQYSANDALYIGGVLNGSPEQYIHFKSGGGIECVTPSEFTVKASKMVIDAPIETTSTIQASGDITDNTSGGNAETMASMRATYNIHTHLENGQGSNTEEPNQKV